MFRSAKRLIFPKFTAQFTYTRIISRIIAEQYRIVSEEENVLAVKDTLNLTVNLLHSLGVDYVVQK